MSLAQAKATFQHVADHKYKSMMPNVVNDYEQLMEKSKLLENTLLAAADAAQAPEDCEPELDEDGNTVAPTLSSDTMLAGLSGGAVATTKDSSTKPSRKRKAAPATTPAHPQQQPLSDAAAVRAGDGSLEDVVATSSVVKRSKKDREQQDMIDAMDDEMKRVASAHLACGKGTSIKCLVALKLQTFTEDAVEKHVKGQTIPSVGL